MKVHHIGDTARERRQKALEYLQEVGLDIQHMERYPHEVLRRPEAACEHRARPLDGAEDHRL